MARGRGSSKKIAGIKTSHILIGVVVLVVVGVGTFAYFKMRGKKAAPTPMPVPVAPPKGMQGAPPPPGSIPATTGAAPIPSGPVAPVPIPAASFAKISYN